MRTELHDVVFVAGETIESTYTRLMDKWFGDPTRLHLDSWMELDIVDGYRITLSTEPQARSERLYFINLGAYHPGEFTELHANTLLVDSDENNVKRRARAALLVGAEQVHTDDLYDVDDCLEITEVDGRHIHLEPTAEVRPLIPNNGYHIIPKRVVQAYSAAKSK